MSNTSKKLVGLARNPTPIKYRRIVAHLMADFTMELSFSGAIEIVDRAKEHRAQGRRGSLAEDLISEAYKLRHQCDISRLQAARNAVDEELSGLTEVDVYDSRLPMRLVTLHGECFDVRYEGMEKIANRDGVLYRFGIIDLVSSRGTRQISVRRSRSRYFYVSNVAEYDRRIVAVLLNTIRRACDSDGFFGLLDEVWCGQEIELDVLDFQQRASRSERKIREFILHAAYWLGYRYGDCAPIKISDVDLEYLGVSACDIERNEEWLEEQGFLDKVSGRVFLTSAFLKIYEEKRFKDECQRERVKEIFRNAGTEIKVPVTSLYVYKKSAGKAMIAQGAAIVCDPSGDIGDFTEAPFPVIVAYYEDNATGGFHLSRYIQRALAAANQMLHASHQLKPQKTFVNSEDLLNVGWLDVENKCIIVHDPVALSDWLGVELVSNRELVM